MMKVYIAEFVRLGLVQDGPSWPGRLSVPVPLVGQDVAEAQHTAQRGLVEHSVGRLQRSPVTRGWGVICPTLSRRRGAREQGRFGTLHQSPLLYTAQV